MIPHSADLSPWISRLYTVYTVGYWLVSTVSTTKVLLPIPAEHIAEELLQMQPACPDPLLTLTCTILFPTIFTIVSLHSLYSKMDTLHILINCVLVFAKAQQQILNSQGFDCVPLYIRRRRTGTRSRQVKWTVWAHGQPVWIMQTTQFTTQVYPGTKCWRNR